MKNQKNTKVLCGLFLSIVFSSLLFTSCKKGDEGAVGANGAAGANGTNGTNGSNGNSILSGEGAPAVSLGVAGDFYLDTKVTALYGPKTTSGWGSPVSLAGAQGADGAQGPQGAAGDAGATALVDTFSIYTEDWMMGDDVFVQLDNNDYYTYAAKYSKHWIPDLTQDILDHGMVIVSFTPSKVNEPSQWLPIPYIITGSDPNDLRVNYNWSYVTGENTLRVQFYFTPVSTTTYYPAAIHNTGMPGPDLEDFNVPDAQYKVVLLPATVTKEIASITKKQFAQTGKVLSN